MTTGGQGGPAFPVKDIGTHGAYGMTLRDYFAAQAVASGRLMVDAKEYELKAWFGPHSGGITQSEILACRAYDLADAMLARRSMP